MADIRLEFGVNTSASINEMKKDLANVAKQLDPVKIKVQFDSKNLNSQVNNLKKQIASIQKNLNNKTINAARTSGQTSQTDPMKTEVKDLRNMNNALQQSTNMMNRYTAAKHSLNAESRDAINTVTTQTQRLQTLKDAYDGTPGSLSKIRTATLDLRKSMKDAEITLRANGDATKSLTDRFGGLASKFSAWLGVSQVIMYAVRAVRKMIDTSIELNSAMTQMQIVTKASNAEMRQFGDDAAQAAQKTASSITDIMSSATTYARLGYSMDESTQLAEYTAMLKNVGDIDVGEAQDAITAIVKAYNINAEDIESIMDKLVETGNHFPISVSEIANGMNNAASTLSAAGNSFEQSVALLTAANTTLQDSAKSSTGLRTIAARIRKVKTELDDLGESMTSADYDRLVQSLTHAGVKITDGTGEIRDTYSIMQDIAKVWDNLSSMEQSGLATALSGKMSARMYRNMHNITHLIAGNS